MNAIFLLAQRLMSFMQMHPPPPLCRQANACPDFPHFPHTVGFLFSRVQIFSTNNTLNVEAGRVWKGKLIYFIYADVFFSFQKIQKISWFFAKIYDF